MRIPPTSPFSPVPLLFLTAPEDSEFFQFLYEAHKLVEAKPSILDSINADLDLHGLKKKAQRIQDIQWENAKNHLPTIEYTPSSVVPSSLRLGEGRPRTSAYVVYLFLVSRGFFGGFKSGEANTLMLESVTLRVFLANQGINLPGGSTLTELVNAVSAETREKILDAQLHIAMQEGWEDGETMIQDSTAVEGNVSWPTDSQLMNDLLGRIWRRGGRLDRVGLSNFDDPNLAKLLGEISLINREINLVSGPKKNRRRRRQYERLLKKAQCALDLLKPQLERTQQALSKLDVKPSLRESAARMFEWLQTDTQNFNRVVDCCEARIVRDEKVPASEKVLSGSDPDASFIVKGGRDTVVGYKAQLARSGNGFVVGLTIPQGNASDSGQLVPMFEQVIARTGIIPETVSVDDGYSSKDGRDNLRAMGVMIVSISGAKGKKITTEDDWESARYVTARNNRSAVESLMFTIKNGFDFGRVARRGLQSVRVELLEKVLAYNFCRMATFRRASVLQEEPLAA